MTKKSMADALRKLMAGKPLAKITISEIVSECGLNRQTFYYHFHDIYDLLHWMLEYDKEQILNQRISADSWTDLLLRVLQYIQDNKAVVLCGLAGMQHGMFNRFLYEEVEPIVEMLVEELAEGLSVSDRYKRFITHFFTTSIAAIVLDWVQETRKDLKMTADEMIHMLDITMRGTIRQALERSQDEIF